jgi:hypothetical protein
VTASRSIQSRVAYLRYFRRERRQSPRSEAEAEHVAAKAALLRLRIAEKQRKLVPVEDFNATIDDLCGLVLTSLSGLSARCSRDPIDENFARVEGPPEGPPMRRDVLIDN